MDNPTQYRRRTKGQPTRRNPHFPLMQIALALGAVLLLALVLELLGGA